MRKVVLFTKTLKVRVRDKHAPVLRQMARAVNTCWNYCNELSYRSIRERGMFLSAYDLHPKDEFVGKRRSRRFIGFSLYAA